MSKISIDRLTKVTDLGILRIEMIKLWKPMKSSGRQPPRKQKCAGRADVQGEGRGRRTCESSPQVVREVCVTTPGGGGAADGRSRSRGALQRPVKPEAPSMVFCELSVYSEHVGVNR